VPATTLPTPEPTKPTARAYHHLTSVDSLRGVLLFGGITSSPPDGAFLGDSWIATAPPGWARADPGSAVPMGDAVAYDAASDRVVVFAIVAPGDSFAPQNETWAYDPAGDAWSLVGTEQPDGLHGARATYDAESDRIIVIAKEAAKVWAYDMDTDTWEERANQTPGLGTYHGIAYDDESDRLVAFGGGTGSGFGATLAYDYNSDTWTDLASDAGPTDRIYHAMAYDPMTDRIIMFGGVQGRAETPSDETWAYDVDTNTWTLLSPATRPGPRGWAALAFNPADSTLVLFGGGPRREEASDETWIFNPATEDWTLTSS
jgi:N-acetylneuraminic acid mutarotase